MGILEDLTALNASPTDPFQVARAISTLVADPAGRLKLIQEWENATGQTFPDSLRHDLIGAAE